MRKTSVLWACFLLLLAVSILPAAFAVDVDRGSPSELEEGHEALGEEKAERVLDAVTSCSWIDPEQLLQSEATTPSPMMGPPGECAYDVICAETCNSIYLDCVFHCSGATGSPPWLACKAGCQADAIECVEHCCL